MSCDMTKPTKWVCAQQRLRSAQSDHRGARWLSGRVSDSGARGPGFETYRRRVVSLSKTLYSPKVLVNYPGNDGSVPTWLKIVDWDVKPQHNQPTSLIRVFAVCIKKAWVLSYPLSIQQRLWSDWADAQADLSLRWAHIHFVGFVMSWLILFYFYGQPNRSECLCVSKPTKQVFPVPRWNLNTPWYLIQHVLRHVCIMIKD